MSAIEVREYGPADRDAIMAPALFYAALGYVEEDVRLTKRIGDMT